MWWGSGGEGEEAKGPRRETREERPVGPRADSGPEKALFLTRLESRPDPCTLDSLIRSASQTKTKEGQPDNVIRTMVRASASSTHPGAWDSPKHFMRVDLHSPHNNPIR